jgi:hypothetical protein
MADLREKMRFFAPKIFSGRSATTAVRSVKERM